MFHSWLKGAFFFVKSIFNMIAEHGPAEMSWVMPVIMLLTSVKPAVFLNHFMTLFPTLDYQLLSFFLQGIFISKIAENGPAEMDGRLNIGDKVLTVSIL